MDDSRHPVGKDDPPRPLFSDEQWSQLVRFFLLTKREGQVAHGMVDDHTEGQIAAALSISTHTVHTHMRSLFRKLDVNGRSGLLICLFRTHLHDLENGGRIAVEDVQKGASGYLT